MRVSAVNGGVVAVPGVDAGVCSRKSDVAGAASISRLCHEYVRRKAARHWAKTHVTISICKIFVNTAFP
jgi:hypothetical protein